MKVLDRKISITLYTDFHVQYMGHDYIVIAFSPHGLFSEKVSLLFLQEIHTNRPEYF